MYGIFTYIWVIFRANVGKYTSTMEHMGITILSNPSNESVFASKKTPSSCLTYSRQADADVEKFRL